MATLHTEIQAFTLSISALQLGRDRSRRASAKAEFAGQQRAETEAEKDAFDRAVAFDEAFLVVGEPGEIRLVDVGYLVQQDLADQRRRRDAQVCGFPPTADFFRVAVDRKDADLARHIASE